MAKELKKQTAVRFNTDTIKYIQTYKEQNGYSSFTAALEAIVAEHQNSNLNPYNLIADKVIEKFDTKYGNALTRIRLGSNGADKNTQVILEILNTIILSNMFQIQDFTPTAQYKAPLVNDAEEAVKERIKYFKQLKDNKFKAAQKD